MQKYNVNHPGVAKNRCRKNRAKKTPPHRLFMVFSRRPKTTLTTDLQSYWRRDEWQLLRTLVDCELFSLSANEVAKFL